MTQQNTYAGSMWKEDAFCVDVVAAEAAGMMAIALGDGRVSLRLLDMPETEIVPTLQVHDGGLTAIALAPDGKSFISAGEDGRVVRIFGNGKTEEIIKLEKAWLEHMALHTESSMLALAYKKTIVLLTCDGTVKAKFENLPSTVGGLAFDPKGKRLAASHYNGVSLYWVNGEVSQKPQLLPWKGSHLNIAWAPNGKYLLTAMQENTLHGWRVADFNDFQMSGYALKPKSFSWNEASRWLATSGSPGIICWDCGGKGPMGKPATILGQECEDIVTKVACHPTLDLVAAGTISGLVYLARFQDDNIVWLKTAENKSAISALRWSETGRVLLGACEDGHAYAWPFAD